MPFCFLAENEYLHRDPALVVRTSRKREELPDVLDRRELTRLLAATDRDGAPPTGGVAPGLERFARPACA